MKKENAIILFHQKKVRWHWDEDPELAFDRAMQTYLKKVYSREWVNQRLKSIEVRKTGASRGSCMVFAEPAETSVNLW